MATAATVFRDYETDGVPASGAHKVKKNDVRGLLAGYEAIINAFTANGGLIYSSKSAMDADLAHAANSMAWVIGDATVANNGIYRKIGASGAGSWTRAADLPFSFIIASDVGAGTANTIVATTSIPVSSSALVWMNIFEANTASPVTVSFNGGSALTIKTNSGNDVAAGGLTAGMIVLGIVSGSTFRLVSDQASAAVLAACEDAQAAAEAAQAAAEAAAAGVNLPPVTADTMLVDDPTGTTRESKTFAQVHALLDPLRGFNANGTADDTANFTALEAIIQNHKVDLHGNTYLVSSIPAGNKYENGWFGITRVPPVGSSILIRTPAIRTLLADTVKLTNGHRYAAWPEHKWHGYNGVTYSFWNEGYAHSSSDLHVRMAKSTDGGQTWGEYSRFFQSTSGQQTCWAAGCLDGQQYVIIREIFSGVTNHKLYGRRLGEKRSVTCNVTTVSGSNVIELAISTHGTRAGQTVEFDDTFTINGVTVTGNTAYTVATNTVDSTLKVTIAGSANATSSGTASRTFDIQFIETGFSHVTFGGVSFGEAVIALGVLTSQPAEYVGIEPVSGQGIFYTGVSRGGATVAPGTVGEIVVKVTGLFSTPTISKVVPTTTADRGETTVRRLSNGNLMGLSRTNNAAAPKMWFSDDDLGTFTVFTNGPGTTFVQASVPFIIVDDTWVVASVTGNRFGDPESATASARNPVPVYLLVGLYTELKAQGWPAFKYYKVGHVFHENRFADNEAPGEGVGSITLFGDTIILGNSTENYDDELKLWNNTNGNPDVYCTRLKLGDFIEAYRTSTQDVIGQNALAVSRGNAMFSEDAYTEEVFGSSTIYCQAFVQGSTGTAFSRRRCTVARTGTGVYTITYDRSLPSNRIFPHVTSCNANGIASVQSVTATVCTVNTKSFAGALTDYDFAFSLSYLNDFAREEWSY